MKESARPLAGRPTSLHVVTRRECHSKSVTQPIEPTYLASAFFGSLAMTFLIGIILLNPHEYTCESVKIEFSMV